MSVLNRKNNYFNKVRKSLIKLANIIDPESEVIEEGSFYDDVSESLERIANNYEGGSGVATIESHFSDAGSWGEIRSWLDADEWEAIRENGVGTPFILKETDPGSISAFGAICDITGSSASVIITTLHVNTPTIVYATIAKMDNDEVYTIYQDENYSSPSTYKAIAPFEYPRPTDQGKCLSVGSNGALTWKLPASFKPVDISTMGTVFMSLLQATSAAAMQSGNIETRHADLGTGGMLQWIINNIVTDFSNKIQSVFALGENYFIADYASKDETSGTSTVHAKAVNITPSGSSIYVFTYDIILYSDGTYDYAIMSATPSVSSALS